MDQSATLESLSGIGKSKLALFNALGINTVDDLLNYFPRRYEDYSTILPINKLKPGKVCIEATIKQAKGRYSRRGLHITEAIASDPTGSVRLIWFNQPYRAEAINREASYYISGNFELSAGKLSINNPSLELVSDMPINSARIIAVYRETKGLNSRQIRHSVAQALLNNKFSETLPDWLIKKYDLISRSEAIENIHRPGTNESLARAKQRLGFEEVFALSLASLLNKNENKSEKSLKVKFNEKLARSFVKHLPFKLTDAQRLTTWKIYQDMEKEEPMNRLIEGDVGSGKTVVAAMACLMAIAEGKQAAFMAPTEILARQHAQTIDNLLKPLNLNKEVSLLVGSMPSSEKEKVYQKIKSAQVKLIIGTQALLQSKVDMHSLALIIIDEQHRFGVDQRKKLMQKAHHMPHVLSLSATPIPRSLALTLYGELDISLLKEKPIGRKHVITKTVNLEAKNRLFKDIEKEIQNGRQMFVVCPNISFSFKSEVMSTEETYREIKQSTLGKYRIGLLHGKLKAAEKNEVMEKFLKRELDILVTTTVIEVGVDVPNATQMLIYNPERFGLAQLHQLRGRIGRGEHQGHFYMLVDSDTQSIKRLKALESSNDGFELAELDLNIRGPGAIYGTAQHGALDLRIANLSDHQLIATAVEAARDFLESSDDLLRYKVLADKVRTLRTVTNLN